MTLWKDHKRGVWRYTFQYQKKIHSGAGYKLKSEAAQAEADHKKRIKEAPTIQAGMGFKDVANIYLDYAQMRFVKKTYKYKRYVYKMFLKKMGNIELDQITPQMIHDYCITRPSKHNYNVHRKELSALFEYAKKHGKNHVTVIEKPNIIRNTSGMMIEEARKMVKYCLKNNPDLKISDIHLPYKNPDDKERYIEGLRKAGFPE